MPALRQTLTKPFVVEPTMDHTHTVVFLHRFPETTTAAIIPSKVLSSRRTKNHKTLTKQFPSVRWVFPYAKTGPRPYADFTADDKDAVGLADANTRSPYITQILLQEAKRVGGLDKVVLGGQGETAIAAHESMACFPEITTAMRDEESAVEEFMKGTFYAPKWTDPAAHPKLAGFVGMHKDDGEVTRDAALRGVAAKARNDPVKVNTSIVVNTKHLLINGGYKVQTETWDGRRIDEFAKFLREEVGVRRLGEEEAKKGLQVSLVLAKSRAEKMKEKEEFELSEAQMYAAKLAREKKEKEVLEAKIKVRIEADKVGRRIRQAREQEARLAGNATTAATRTNEHTKRQGFVYGPPPDVSFREDVNVNVANKGKRARNPPGRRLGGDGSKVPGGAKGEIGQARMRALGLRQEEEEAKIAP